MDVSDYDLWRENIIKSLVFLLIIIIICYVITYQFNYLGKYNETEYPPGYRTVVFHDTNVDEYFLIGSTLKTDRTIEWEDGNTYPYFTIEVSSKSHPFYTGKQRVLHKEDVLRTLLVVLVN